MIKHLFLVILFSLCGAANAAECSLYEKSHPLFLLDGAHLSTGKCTTCGSCHKGGIFMGTPKTCISCHNGDPRWTTVGRSARHIPTLMVDCNNCHRTTLFTLNASMNHTSVVALRCDSCHNGAYKSYGAEGKPNDHPKTRTIKGVLVTVSAVDCNYSGCHTTRTFD